MKRRLSSASDRGRVFIGCAAALSFLLSGVAHAEPTAADKDAARALMLSGIERRDKGDLKAALKDFQAADGIMHVPSTGIEVAKTLAALGQLIEARDAAQGVVRLPSSGGEPQPFVDARRKARALSEEIEGKLPSLLLQVTNTPGGAQPSAVFLDDRLVNLSIVSSPHKVNPGHYSVRVQAGEATGRAEADVRERETKTVTVDFGASNKAVATPAPEVVTDKEPEKVDEAPAEPKSDNTLKYVGYAGLGVGAVGLVVGTITGVMVLSNRKDLDAMCPNGRCPKGEPTEKLEGTQSLSTLSTVAFIVGAIGVGVGITSLILHKPKPTPTSSARVTPFLGPGSVGVRGVF